jgi:hypothetical protein
MGILPLKGQPSELADMDKFLGAFAKFEMRLLASPCPSVRPSIHPSVRMEQFGFHWTEFHKNLTRITGTLHEDQ